jgi:hypothetical protein
MDDITEFIKEKKLLISFLNSISTSNYKTNEFIVDEYLRNKGKRNNTMIKKEQEITVEYLLINGYEKDVDLYIKKREDMDDICVMHRPKRNLFIANTISSLNTSISKIVKTTNDLFLFEIVTGFTSPTDAEYSDWEFDD